MSKLLEIRNRWNGTNTNYCKHWVREVIENGQRNMTLCYGFDENNCDGGEHPVIYDSEKIANAPADIHYLLNKIKELEKQMQNIQR